MNEKESITKDKIKSLMIRLGKQKIGLFSNWILDFEEEFLLFYFVINRIVNLKEE